MIEKCEELGIKCRDTEDFDGTPGGIWVINAEFHPSFEDGMPIMDYYQTGESYEFGIHTKFGEMCSEAGWFCEWYDPGTLMIYQD
jgi:hypothetical protein